MAKKEQEQSQEQERTYNVHEICNMLITETHGAFYLKKRYLNENKTIADWIALMDNDKVAHNTL